MAGNFNLQRILGNMPGMAGGGGQQQEDAALADTAEQVGMPAPGRSEATHGGNVKMQTLHLLEWLKAFFPIIVL